MHIPVRSGRAFDARDGEQPERVAVVNGTFARRYLGGGEVVGRRIRFGGVDATSPWITIVGTVGDVHHSDTAKGWLLTRYDDCYSALRDPRLGKDYVGRLDADSPEEAGVEPVAGSPRDKEVTIRFGDRVVGEPD